MGNERTKTQMALPSGNVTCNIAIKQKTSFLIGKPSISMGHNLTYYRTSPFISMGHFPVRKLLVYQAG
jgi:hypothetical protein